MELMIDSHAHYDDRRFDEDREAVIASLIENGVGAVIDAGCDFDTTAAAIALAEKYDFFYHNTVCAGWQVIFEYTLQFDKENNRAKRERKNDGEKYILRAAESLRLLTAHRRFVIIYIAE